MRTAKEVKQAVSLDLRRRGLNRTDAGTLVGLKPQTLTNLLCRDAYFNEKQAWRFHQAFGYDEKFLLTGEGELIQKEGAIEPEYKEVVDKSFYFEVMDDFLSVLDDTVAYMPEIRTLEEAKTLWKKVSIYLDLVKIISKIITVRDQGGMMRVNKEKMKKYIDDAKGDVLGMIER